MVISVAATVYVPLVDLSKALKEIQSAGLAAMNDPTGLGSRFGACSSESNRLDAMSKLDAAVRRAGLAFSFAHNEDDAKVIEQLKLLFDR